MVKLLKDDSGVSVIVGALLLILIVVIAAAGLAMIVSQAERQQADRQALQDAVKNEKLKIVSIKPTFNATNDIQTIKLNVQNLNIDDSRVISISVNDIYASGFYSGGVEYDFTNRLDIPATRNVTIDLDATKFVSALNIKNTDSITVQIGTTYINFFSKTIKPPAPVMKVNIMSEDLGVVQRDYIMLDGSDSSSETGQILSYKWTIAKYPSWVDSKDYFGKVVRVNPQWINPNADGPFMVNLTVIDDSLLQGKADFVTIPENTNFNPPVSLTATYYKDNTTMVARLNDSNNEGSAERWVSFVPATANISVWPSGSNTDSNGMAKATVNFNGDTSNGNVLISYGKLSYYVQVTAQSPSAEFSGLPVSGTSPLSVQFTDASTGIVNVRQWIFGDLSPNSILKDPVHTFPVNPGPNAVAYTIMLTVSNAGGSNTLQKVGYITVDPQAPVADFTYTATGPSTIQFTDASTGGAVGTRLWDFGDGSGTSNLKDPSYVYAIAGSYTIKLTTTNAGGSTNKSISINVV